MGPPAWNDVHLETAKAIAGRRYRSALDQLSDFLRDAESRDERREALALRATVQMHLGDSESAQRDLELAHSLSRPGEYSRYTVELLLARVARDRLDPESARRLYSQALQTALTGGGFSAGTALEGFMQVTAHSGLTEAEHVLIRDSISASWRTLGLEECIPVKVDDCILRILSVEGGG